MGKTADSISRGLEQAVRFAKGRKRGFRVHVPPQIDVRAVRSKLGMTQETFAHRFGFSLNTLRHWEQGKRQPRGAARAFLVVINRAPRAVQRALAESFPSLRTQRINESDAHPDRVRRKLERRGVKGNDVQEAVAWARRPGKEAH